MKVDLFKFRGNMPDPFEIVVGTYEQFLLGYRVNSIVNQYKMEKTFATHSHLSSIRSVASSKYYLASGGADDSVNLYDLRYRVESGRLMHHNDSVTGVSFTPEATHLLTCSNDGSIAAIRCGNWQMEKLWQKAHKGLAVNTLAIHPTGKIALSTGADGILRTWNLVKGRQAYATNLAPRLKLDAKNVTVVRWSPNGEKYLLAVNQRIDVYSVELAGIDNEIKLDSKIVCVEFLRDDLIAVGLENGQIKLYDLEKSVQTVKAIAHDIRVKCMASKDNLLVTASSFGEIKLWRYSKHKLHMLQSVNCGARITCLSLAIPYKDLADREDVKDEVAVEEETKKEKKFRLKQEVVVEQEGNWQVTSIDAPQTEPASKKSKKKRSIEEVQHVHMPDGKRNKSLLKKKKRVDDPVGDDIPKKKKKKKQLLIDVEGEDYGKFQGDDENKSHTPKMPKMPNRKRKNAAILLEENNNAPLIGGKKLCEENSRADSAALGKSKSKLKSSPKEHGNVLPKKRKKEKVVEEAGTVLKKKKKKQ